MYVLTLYTKVTNHHIFSCALWSVHTTTRLLLLLYMSRIFLELYQVVLTHVSSVFQVHTCHSLQFSSAGTFTYCTRVSKRIPEYSLTHRFGTVLGCPKTLLEGEWCLKYLFLHTSYQIVHLMIGPWLNGYLLPYISPRDCFKEPGLLVA